MRKVGIITDSNSGIKPDQAKDMGISVVPMPFIIGEETYYEEISLSRKEFFQRMEEGQKIVTSQPAPGEVMKIWDKALEKYDQVVYIPMSSGLSGSCQTAIMLADDYDGKVEVVNNQRISVTMKASVEDAIAMAEKGMDAAAIRERLEAVRFDSSIYIMLDTLEYLKRGGRITPAAAAIGTLLRLKPVLQIKGERLDAFSKARALNQGKMTMINAMKKDISELYGGVETETCKLYAVHASCPEPFRVWADEVAPISVPARWPSPAPKRWRSEAGNADRPGRIPEARSGRLKKHAQRFLKIRGYP